MSPSKTKPSGIQTILWWLVWITLTILTFFAAAALWTPLVAKHFGSIRETRASAIWIIAVFGTWMVFLVPLIVVMYQRVDKVYEDSRIRRENAARRYKSIFVEPGKRKLPKGASSTLKSLAPLLEGGHLVHLTLKDGRKIPNVFVSAQEEILGIYDVQEFAFEGRDVASLEPVDFKTSPVFMTQSWLRLDGVPPPGE
jgi:hypothetical protein